MLLFVLFFGVLLWVVVFRFRRRRMYQLASKIPSSNQELPLIGIAHRMIGNTEDIMKTMTELCYKSMEAGGLIREWNGPVLYFMLVDPVDLEFVLKTCLEKDDLHRFMRSILGNGGIYAPVPIWRQRRKILVPAFSPKIVESFVDVFYEQSEKLAKRFEQMVNVGKFSIWPYVSTCTFDSIFQSALGVKMNSQDDPKSPFVTALNEILQLVAERIFQLWLQPDWLYKLFPQYKKHEEHIKKLHNFTDDVIAAKRNELINTPKEVVETKFDLATYKTESFLEILIRLSGGEKGFTNLELREEVLVLAIAGTDTSAATIGFAMMLLAKHPEVQEKVYQELFEVFGESKRPLVKGDMPHLKYLERVIKETLRLYPPVPFVIRKVLDDIKLPSGRVLPAGSGVICAIWGAHRDPAYWGPTAEQFDPDRFLPERFDSVKNPCSYMPFSHGPRNCVGYQYALLSVKTTLATVLRRFKIVPDTEVPSTSNLRVKIDVILKEVNGYRVALEKREPTAKTYRKI